MPRLGSSDFPRSAGDSGGPVSESDSDHRDDEILAAPGRMEFVLPQLGKVDRGPNHDHIVVSLWRAGDLVAEIATVRCSAGNAAARIIEVFPMNAADDTSGSEP